MWKVVVGSLVLTTLVSTARAEEPDTKSEDTALMLSLGGTGASVALMAIGGAAHSDELVLTGLASTLVTPSFGHWYAHRPLTAGMAIRAVSAVATIYGLSSVIGCDGEDHCNEHGELLVAGLLGYAGGAIYDIATAPISARRYNEAHAAQFAVTPTMLRSPSGYATMGVGIAGTF